MKITTQNHISAQVYPEFTFNVKLWQ